MEHKYTQNQARGWLRAIAITKGLGEQAALDILAEHGDGAANFAKLKPKYYDTVCEACIDLCVDEIVDVVEAYLAHVSPSGGEEGRS